jgi:hypothetical protein
MTTPRPDVVHPDWCSPAHCTAQPTPTADEYSQAGTTGYGRHMSRPVDLSLCTIHLSQSIAPWPTSTFANLTKTHPDRGYPVPEPLADMIGALVALTGGIHADPCPTRTPHPPHTYPTGGQWLTCPGMDPPAPQTRNGPADDKPASP